MCLASCYYHCQCCYYQYQFHTINWKITLNILRCFFPLPADQVITDNHPPLPRCGWPAADPVVDWWRLHPQGLHFSKVIWVSWMFPRNCWILNHWGAVEGWSIEPRKNMTLLSIIRVVRILVMVYCTPQIAVYPLYTLNTWGFFIAQFGSFCIIVMAETCLFLTDDRAILFIAIKYHAIQKLGLFQVQMAKITPNHLHVHRTPSKNSNKPPWKVTVGRPLLLPLLDLLFYWTMLSTHIFGRKTSPPCPGKGFFQEMAPLVAVDFPSINVPYSVPQLYDLTRSVTDGFFGRFPRIRGKFGIGFWVKDDWWVRSVGCFIHIYKIILEICFCLVPVERFSCNLTQPSSCFKVSNDSVGDGTGGSTQPMDLRGIPFNTFWNNRGL